MRIYTLPFILTTLCLSGGALAQPTHRVVRLSPPEAYRPSETSIAINPVNPDNIIGTSIQYNKQGGPRVNGHSYVTTDGGKTWRDVALVNPRNLSQGDDSITFDATGRAFHAYMSFDGIRVPNPPRAYSGIYIVSTSDGGQSWSAPVPVIDHVNSIMPFEDKPWVVTDNAAASPYKNRVYLAWTRFDVYGSKNPEHKSHIMFAASHDGGVSFRPVSKISDESGDALDGDGTLEGAITAVGLKGEVYVIWSGPKGLVMDKSMDGGVTFGKDKIIGAHPGGWDMEIPGV
ncbi:MAG: sialidase family protein, partial [Blastocatellia bacterium]